MARVARVLLDNGYYHITQRGNNKRIVFHHPGDYTYYLHLIKRYQEKWAFALYHFCLMPNHVHLLLKIFSGKDFPKVMQGINLAYTSYYKRRYGFIGLLWQGRYKDFPIETDEYLLACGRYIELNPVRAGLSKSPKDYPFSSYRYYAFGEQSEILTEDILYRDFGENPAERQRRYRHYVEDGIVAPVATTGSSAIIATV